MMRKRKALAGITLIGLLISIGLPSCKSCNKSDSSQTSHTDSVATPLPSTAVNPINLPHADSSLAPVLAKVMDEVFDASKKKDYNKLSSYLIYRGPDMKRLGFSVFNPKNAYERNVVRITGEVFNKWATGCETIDYARIFDLSQPGGQSLAGLEVIFVSKKGVNRKFFVFTILDKDQVKIVEVTSNL